MARKYYGEEFNPAADRIELRESHQSNSQVKPQNKLQEESEEKPQDASQEKAREKGKLRFQRLMSVMMKGLNCTPCVGIHL